MLYRKNKLKALSITTLVSSAFLLSGCLSSSSDSDTPKTHNPPAVDESFDPNDRTADGSSFPQVAVQSFIEGYSTLERARYLFDEYTWDLIPEAIDDQIGDAIDSQSTLNETFSLNCSSGSGNGSISFNGTRGTLTQNWNNCLHEDGTSFDGRMTANFEPTENYFQFSEEAQVTINQGGNEYTLTINLDIREFDDYEGSYPDTVKGSASVSWNNNVFGFSQADFKEEYGRGVTGTAIVYLGALDRSFNLEISQHDHSSFEYTYMAGDFEQSILGSIGKFLSPNQVFNLNGEGGACTDGNLPYSDITAGAFCH